MRRVTFYPCLLALCMVALPAPASADKLDPLVSVDVTHGTLNQISRQIAQQTGNRVNVPVEVQHVTGITLVVKQTPLSSALEMLSPYNICAWRQTTQDSGDSLFVEFGYCNSPPFPKEMAHWFEPW